MHDQSSKDKRAWDEHTSHYKGNRQSSSQHVSSMTHHWAAAVTILAPIGINAAQKLGLSRAELLSYCSGFLYGFYVAAGALCQCISNGSSWVYISGLCPCWDTVNHSLSNNIAGITPNYFATQISTTSRF
jgi:hypothetical protein